MHIADINWVAVLVAAAAFYAIGYVIHLQLVDLEAWDTAKHTDRARLSGMRMAFGVVLPIATAIGIAVLFSWANVAGVGNGIKWGLVIALASALPVLWYNWFYGTAPIWIFWVDSAHQLLGHAVVGAILAGWR
jgi:predicted small integral membrane protein